MHTHTPQHRDNRPRIRPTLLASIVLAHVASLVCDALGAGTSLSIAVYMIALVSPIVARQVFSEVEDLTRSQRTNHYNRIPRLPRA